MIKKCHYTWATLLYSSDLNLNRMVRLTNIILFIKHIIEKDFLWNKHDIYYFYSRVDSKALTSLLFFFPAKAALTNLCYI